MIAPQKSPSGRPQLLLIANYPADRQQSMLRYAEILERHLPARGIPVTVWSPPVFFGRLSAPGRPLFKWLAYLDKYLLFPIALAIGSLLRRFRAGSAPTLVHICDHSNALYIDFLAGLPCLVTCHDVGAIRGALGDLDDCPATGFGTILQKAIVRGLRRIGWIACVSEATRQDLLRWVAPAPIERVRVIPNGLNQSFRHTAEETHAELRAQHPGLLDRPYLLNVGSGLARKNREGVMRIFAEFKKEWPGRLVFVGESLSPALLSLRDSLGLAADEVRSIEDPSSLLLEACYRHAFALLFPTRFEGFGWPVVEAQACGCPVLTTTVSALPEVAGNGACLRDPGDEAGFVADLRALREPSFREELIGRGTRNAGRFTTEEMVARFVRLYEEIACAP